MKLIILFFTLVLASCANISNRKVSSTESEQTSNVYKKNYNRTTIEKFDDILEQCYEEYAEDIKQTLFSKLNATSRNDICNVSTPPVRNIFKQTCFLIFETNKNRCFTVSKNRGSSAFSFQPIYLAWAFNYSLANDILTDNTAVTCYIDPITTYSITPEIKINLHTFKDSATNEVFIDELNILSEGRSTKTLFDKLNNHFVIEQDPSIIKNCLLRNLKY